MGYWTYFTLRLEGTDEACKKVENDILEKDDGFQELVDSVGVLMKWYDWETDITDVALKNPDVLIILDGEGEESDDNWEWRAKGKEIEMRYVCLPPLQNKNLLTKREKEDNNN